MTKIIGSSFTVNTVEGGVTYSIVSTVPSVTIASNATSAALSTQLSFYKKEGDTDAEPYSCYYAAFFKKGTAYTLIKNISTKGTGGTLSTTCTASYDSVVICIYDANKNTHDGYLAEFEITINKQGDKGDKGNKGDKGDKGNKGDKGDKGNKGDKGDKGNKGDKGDKGNIGRSYYYAGEYSSTTAYKVTAYEAPYVSYNSKYYVRIGDDNDSTTGVAPSNSSKWAEMETNFKYLITQAIFSQYGQLGSWIFNGDYMYSNQGLNSSGSSVSSSSTNVFAGVGASATTYTPNIVFNALTGYAHFGAGKVSFNTDGSGQLANSSITWDASGNLKFLSGTIGNWHVTSNAIYSEFNASAKFYVESSDGFFRLNCSSTTLVSIRNDRAACLSLQNYSGTYPALEILANSTSGNQTAIESFGNNYLIGRGGEATFINRLAFGLVKTSSTTFSMSSGYSNGSASNQPCNAVMTTNTSSEQTITLPANPKLGMICLVIQGTAKKVHFKPYLSTNYIYHGNSASSSTTDVNSNTNGQWNWFMFDGSHWQCVYHNGNLF